MIHLKGDKDYHFRCGKTIKIINNVSCDNRNQQIRDVNARVFPFSAHKHSA